MSNREDQFVRVRIPKELIATLTELLNQDVRVDGSGFLERFPTSRHLVGNGMYDASPSNPSYIVNLALLGFMSGLVEQRKLVELIEQTPSVGFESYRLASERLSPKSTVVVPTTIVEDIADTQRLLMDELDKQKDAMEKQQLFLNGLLFGHNRALAVLLDQSVSSGAINDVSYYSRDAFNKITSAFMGDYGSYSDASKVVQHSDSNGDGIRTDNVQKPHKKPIPNKFKPVQPRL